MAHCRETTIVVNLLLVEDGHAHCLSSVRVEMEFVHVASCK